MQKFVRIQESKGKRIEELVKGSLDYTRYEIEQAFRMQFPNSENQYYYISEVFDDHVIVSVGGSEMGMRDPLKNDEYYNVSFMRAGEIFTFAAREQWTVVELTYQPQTMTESVWMLESAQDGARKIRVNRLMTAGEVNGNNRRYPAPVLKAAVEELKSHLHESAGQGRLMLLGEVEHPSDKRGRANLMETVIRWTDVSFDGTDVNAVGLLATETEGGRQIQALAAIGVAPGGSIRGYGAMESVKEGGKQLEQVKELHITGIDIVSEASFSNSETILESVGEPGAGDNKMNLLEKLVAMLKARPDLFKVSEAEMRAMTESQLDTLWGRISEAMAIDPAKLNITEALKEMASKAAQFDEGQKHNLVEAAISEATKDLPYGAKNAMFVEAIRAANPQDAAAVKSLVESKRKEYDTLFAGQALQAMGFTGRISGIAPVIEAQTGTPEFARGAFQIAESIRRTDMTPTRDWSKPVRTINEEFTRMILEKFDKDYGHQLMAESRMITEAETTSDMNLPYSVSRAIIEEAFPNLVASGIFDVGVTDQAPSRIYYETFAGETGYTVTVTAEAVVSSLNNWVSLGFKRVTPGTVTVTHTSGAPTYVDGTDYVIDYANGRIKTLATIVDGATIKVTYTYSAIRKGENATIERGKLTLAYKTLEIAADRLADEVTREAIVFGRSQLGWDALGRTLSALVRQIRRKIDGGMLYMALSAALSVPSNSGGTWTKATDTLDDLIKKLGAARVLVANRYYEPTAVIGSLTNVELLSHWDGFTAAGKRPGDDRLGNGLAGSVNGLPVFWSTEHSDSYLQVVNRELVMHRVYQALLVKGPFPTYHTDGKLKANEQYFVEEFNGTDAPVAEKGATVKVV